MTKKKENNTSQVSSLQAQTLPLTDLSEKRKKKKTLPLTEGLEFDIVEVQKLMGYSFNNVKLLKEALTHPSFTDSPEFSFNKSASNKRLAFLGDTALNHVFTEYLFITYPYLDPGSLTDLRKANVCTDKMARVAVRHNLYLYLRRYNVSGLNKKVRKYTKSSRKDETVVNAKPPKVLADIVESIAGAVYVDSKFDLNRLGEVFRGHFEPIVLPDTIEQMHKKKGAIHISITYMGGMHCGTGISEDKEMAKLKASLASLKKCVEKRLDLERKRQAWHEKNCRVVEKGEESKQKLNVAMASFENLRVNLSIPEAKRQTSHVDCCQVVQRVEESKQNLNASMNSSEKSRVSLSEPNAKRHESPTEGCQVEKENKSTRHASPGDCCQVVQKEEESKQNLNASMNSLEKLRVSLSKPDAKRHESLVECCQVEKEDESKKKLNGCNWMCFFFSCFIIYFLFSMVDNVG